MRSGSLFKGGPKRSCLRWIYISNFVFREILYSPGNFSGQSFKSGHRSGVWGESGWGCTKSDTARPPDFSTRTPRKRGDKPRRQIRHSGERLPQLRGTSFWPSAQPVAPPCLYLAPGWPRSQPKSWEVRVPQKKAAGSTGTRGGSVVRFAPAPRCVACVALGGHDEGAIIR